MGQYLIERECRREASHEHKDRGRAERQYAVVPCPAENFDHDDMHGYLPPASTQVIDNACRTVGGGGKHLLTIEGYMNAAAGFDEYSV